MGRGCRNYPLVFKGLEKKRAQKKQTRKGKSRRKGNTLLKREK